MKVNIVSITKDPEIAIASAYGISKGITYDEYVGSERRDEKVCIELIKKCIESRHMSGLEFANIDVEVLGVSRVLEAELIRSRLSSYMVEAGLYTDRRDFDTALPFPGLWDDATKEERIATIRKWNAEDKVKRIDQRLRRYWAHQGLSRRMRISANVRSWVERAHARMCETTQPEYRQFMDKLKTAVREWEIKNDKKPFLSAILVPQCEVLGYCPVTFKPCGKYLRKQ